jgi:hypothetical protein
VRDVSSDNFGLLIAYLLPGFAALWGVRLFVPGVDAWLAASPDAAPTVGGFLYVTLGSVAAGMLVSTLRWAVLDTLHHRTGIPQPSWDFARFPANVAAFDSLVQDHYRYYQHYGNMLVALAFVYASSTWVHPGLAGHSGWRHVAFLVSGIVLYLGSRDALRKYYERTAAILGRQEHPPAPRVPLPASAPRLSPLTARLRTEQRPADRSTFKPLSAGAGLRGRGTHPPPRPDA